MKQIFEKLTTALFVLFLFGMLLAGLIMPKESFSSMEKRYLAELPVLNLESISSGAWGEALETYLADHMPGREFFVGLNAYKELYLGLQAGADVQLKDGRLIEAPNKMDNNAVQKNMKALNTFAQQVDGRVWMAIVPSTGWAMGDAAYSDAEMIASVYENAAENVAPIDLMQVFSGHPERFYRTDHHWNSAGAYAGYAALMEAMGKSYPQEDAFEKEVLTGVFQGSTYSRSALWLTPAEDVELWHGSAVTVTNGETQESHDGVFYRERLEEADKYTVFLDGNHSIVRIVNPQQEGRLLVIRDSFSNSLGCFLAESYGEVVLVDLRYYRKPVSALAAEEAFDDILFCYSIGNFLTDTNIIWLR